MTEEQSELNNADDGGKITHISFFGRLRNYFFAGILITAPVTITIYLSWLFIQFVDHTVTPLIPARFNPENYLPFGVPGLGLVVVFISLTMIGMLTTGFLSRFIMKIYDRVLERIPVVSSIYSALKQITETVLSQKSNAFREAVLIEYPRRGVWVIGFITGTTKGEAQNLTEETTINIFVPTTPNPTSGFLLFVPKKDVIPLKMTVEEALKLVISGGLVTPEDPRPLDQQETPVTSCKTYEEVDIIREKDGEKVQLVSKHPEVSENREDA